MRAGTPADWQDVHLATRPCKVMRVHLRRSGSRLAGSPRADDRREQTGPRWGGGACERPTESSNPTVVRTGRVRQKVDAVTTDRPHRARVHPSRRADPPPCNDPSNYLG